MNTEIICQKCGYRYWIPSVWWSTVPPDTNCPMCFPSRFVTTIHTNITITPEEKNGGKKLLKEIDEKIFKLGGLVENLREKLG